MFNEQENVADTVTNLHAALQGLGTYEIVLVNDGSTDQTESVARAIAAEDDAVTVVSYHPNAGRGKALRSGLAAARGEIIASTEADLSWGGDILQRMTRALNEQPGADLVVASPYRPGGRLESVPWLRGQISRLGNRVLCYFMPGDLTMRTGMTRAYRRSVIEALELESDGKEIHIEILSKAYALGYRAIEISATLSGRKKGKSKFKFKATALSHLAHSFHEKPMMLFGVAGLGLLLIGALIGGFLAFQLLFQHHFHLDRPFTVLLLLCVLAGLQMLGFGFLGTQLVLLRKELYRIQRMIRRSERDEA